METIESIHSDFIADVCLIPDVELIRIRFEHPSISGTIVIKKSIKKRGFNRDTNTIRYFLNAIKKYIYDVHYEVNNNSNFINSSELLSK